MGIYDSFGTFDATKAEFNLAGQTTNIGTDNFVITAYYDISNTNRFAILAILQTVDGNDNDLRTDPANCACMASEIKFNSLIKSYWTPGDKNIDDVQQGNTIHVVLHHGIGFDPTTNQWDNDYIVNYKAETYTYYDKGSQPGRGGKGVLE